MSPSVVCVFSMCASTTSLAATRPSVLHSAAMEICYILLSPGGMIKSASRRLRWLDETHVCCRSLTVLSSTNQVRRIVDVSK